jgi:hypothetical protein
VLRFEWERATPERREAIEAELLAIETRPGGGSSHQRRVRRRRWMRIWRRLYPVGYVAPTFDELLAEAKVLDIPAAIPYDYGLRRVNW